MLSPSSCSGVDEEKLLEEPLCSRACQQSRDPHHGHLITCRTKEGGNKDRQTNVAGRSYTTTDSIRRFLALPQASSGQELNAGCRRNSRMGRSNTGLRNSQFRSPLSGLQAQLQPRKATLLRLQRPCVSTPVLLHSLSCFCPISLLSLHHKHTKH